MSSSGIAFESHLLPSAQWRRPTIQRGPCNRPDTSLRCTSAGIATILLHHRAIDAQGVYDSTIAHRGHHVKALRVYVLQRGFRLLQLYRVSYTVFSIHRCRNYCQDSGLPLATCVDEPQLGLHTGGAPSFSQSGTMTMQEQLWKLGQLSRVSAASPCATSGMGAEEGRNTRPQ